MSLNPADYRSAVRACIAAGLVVPPPPEPPMVSGAVKRAPRVTPPGPCSHRPPLGKRAAANQRRLETIARKKAERERAGNTPLK